MLCACLFLCAAACNDPESLTLLLSRGVDITTVNADGNTLLHAAAASHHEQIVMFLLETGVAVNLLNSKGQTPLDLALATGQCRTDETQTNRVVQLLMQYGAKKADALHKTDA